MTVTESIERFCAYFEHEVCAISRLTIAPLTGDVNVESAGGYRYRKVLYVTAIDTLAGLRYHKSAYPQLSGQNRERFTRFVKEHGSWHEGELVSLPFLQDKLDRLKIVQRPLGQHIAAKLHAYSTDDGGTLLVTDLDEPFVSLLTLASTDKEEEAIRGCQHGTLLYRYRNSLVHESREPGYGMDFFADSPAPCYHGYIGDPKWYLVYPPSLFESLLQRALASFRTFLSANSIDPYTIVEDQARW